MGTATGKGGIRCVTKNVAVLFFWESLFSTALIISCARLFSDSRAFPTDMLEQHKAAVKGAVIKLGAVAAVAVAVFVQAVIKLVS